MGPSTLAANLPRSSSSTTPTPLSAQEESTDMLQPTCPKSTTASMRWKGTFITSRPSKTTDRASFFFRSRASGLVR